MKQISIKDDRLRIWSKNWSSRGVAMINHLDNEPSKITVQRNYIPIQQQLKRLSWKEPKNIFYNSLLEQMKARPLSPKQIESIQRDFVKKCNKT